MDRAARMAALGISSLAKRPPPIADYLEETKREIKGTNLRLFTRLNSHGEVVNYTLKRVVDGRFVFMGERTSPRAIYQLAMKCKTTTPAKAEA